MTGRPRGRTRGSRARRRAPSCGSTSRARARRARQARAPGTEASCMPHTTRVRCGGAGFAGVASREGQQAGAYGARVSRKIAPLEEGPDGDARCLDRRLAPLLPIDERDDAAHLEAFLPAALDGLERRSAGRHDVLEDAHPRPSRNAFASLDPLLRAVTL